MRRLGPQALRWCLPVVAAMALVGSVNASPGGTRALALPSPLMAGVSGVVRGVNAGCAAGVIRDVTLPARVTVDEIVIVLAPGSPARGAAAVEVASGHWERVMHVAGETSKRMRFSPPLASRAFQIALMPVFDARADACVSRIELRSAGRNVASVHP